MRTFNIQNEKITSLIKERNDFAKPYDELLEKQDKLQKELDETREKLQEALPVLNNFNLEINKIIYTEVPLDKYEMVSKIEMKEDILEVEAYDLIEDSREKTKESLENSYTKSLENLEENLVKGATERISKIREELGLVH